MLENKLCSIENCGRKIRAKGLCCMHYTRIRSGITDMRPEHLPVLGWGWHKRPHHIDTICSVDGCQRKTYAKNLCQPHYALNLKYGSPVYKRILNPAKKCSAQNCDEIGNIKGFCKFHYNRSRHGTNLDRPKGIKGELNYNWNGGVAEYPNHTQMKRIRKQVLSEENFTCFYCGKPTKKIHHIDGTKYNHERSNLHACCHGCNLRFAGPHQSKYTRAYGKKLTDLSKELNINRVKLAEMHRNGQLRGIFMKDEIKQILF